MNLEFVIVIGWLILVLGFLKKDYTIVSLSGLFLMMLGTDLLIKNYNGLTNQGFGAIHIAIGFYVLFRGGTETYKGKSFRKPTWIRKKEEKKNGIQKERRN